MARSHEILRRLKVAGQRRLASRGIVVNVHRRGHPDHFTFVEASGRHYPVDFERPWIETIERVLPFTLTSPERLAALCSATEHIVRHDIRGGIVECGVWRGGSMMAVALTLRRLGVSDRDLYLFDTFHGMTHPTHLDVDYANTAVLEDWPEPESGVEVGAVPVAEVNEALSTTGYEHSRLHYIEGDVLRTLPACAPAEIALLRLDTDWYESTRHELIQLYPRLVPGGILIIDDYGHFHGARRATDEYFDSEPIYLSRIDYSARLAVKPSGCE